MEHDDRFVAPAFHEARRHCVASADEKRLNRLDDKFEKLVWNAFRSLGYEVRELGHNHRFDRVPDGLAFSQRSTHGFILDAKLYADYHITTDDRTHIEYVNDFAADFETRSVESISLIIVACGFGGEWERNITRIREGARTGRAGASFVNVILLESEALLYLCQAKLRCIAVNDDYFDNLHRAKSGVVDAVFLKAFTERWLRVHGIGAIVSTE